MAPLHVDLRNQLARAIQEARREGEAGARKALQSLAVHLGKAHDSMDAAGRILRGRLRAHGKQLGDVRDPVKDTQEIGRLAHEIAYEHWHRMLFARFLAENSLLIEPTHRVAISMEECEELAREQGGNPWALAASYAQAMLPNIFRVDDPVLDVQLPPETRLALERILQTLPSVVFKADDSLGWTYQFWQGEKKDEVNRSGNKIGANELPAVTQLFTEHYMVLFLLHNTIGAWRAGRILAANQDLARNARDEDELRRAVRLSVQGGYEFSYLRFVRCRTDGDADNAPTGPWRPAAGTFDAWPARAAELRVLDPCCGSGHFLIEAFKLLVRLRLEEESISDAEASFAVASDNLFGLEIDSRCAQIAAFNVAMTAWRLCNGVVPLPVLSIACVGRAPRESKIEWKELAARILAQAHAEGSDSVVRGLSNLEAMASKAPMLGSLVDPDALPNSLLTAAYESLRPHLRAMLTATLTEDQREGVWSTSGMVDALELLAGKYTLVATNVPFRQTGDFDLELAASVIDLPYEGGANIATLFVHRIDAFLSAGGCLAAVLPQDWLYKDRYESFRNWALSRHSWRVLGRLGPGAFETISGEVVNVCLLAWSKTVPSPEVPFACIDVQTLANPQLKAEGLTLTPVAEVDQASQRQNPLSIVITASSNREQLLAECATYHNGIQAGDLPRFSRFFWELPHPGAGWAYQQSTVDRVEMFGGRSQLFWWQDDAGDYRRFVESRLGRGAAGSWIRGGDAWGQRGVLVSAMGALPVSLYEGHLFDDNTIAVIPKDPALLPALWAFMSSPEYARLVKQTDGSLKVRGGLVRVSFDTARWNDEAKAQANLLDSPESPDPTQWLFHGHPRSSTEPLQAAVARLLGYRWPSEIDPEMRLSGTARTLIGQSEDLLPLADTGGIVCIPSVRGEKPAADRLLGMMSACGVKPDRDLDAWLRGDFFKEHCKLFTRPFIWHIWDGRPDGFHALVNYHRLAGPKGEGRRTLEALTFSYLGDWIERQKADQRVGKEGADGRLAAAQDLQAQLERILAGEQPYDIFARWKPLHEQPVGWDPDTNDGVRINIRPFMSVELQKGGRAGAGILRWKPNITWKKDRGNEPTSIRPIEEFPWFWGCPGDGSPDERTNFNGRAEFDGCRWNDLHYSLAEKRAATARAEEQGK